MNNKLKLAAALAIALSSGASICNADAGDLFCLQPYVGADAQMRYMPFKKDFGSNLFSKYDPQGNIYVGLKLNDYIGIEAGYYSTIIRNTTAFIPANTVVLGLPPFDTTARRVNTFHLHGLHGNLVVFIPMCNEYQIEGIGFCGLTHQRIRLKSITTQIGGVQTNLNDPEFTRNFRKTKNTVRAGIGLQQLLSSCIGIRATLFWENTSKFGEIRAQSAEQFERAEMHDSICASLGIFYNF